jgi:hypothetical protein
MDLVVAALVGAGLIYSILWWTGALNTVAQLESCEKKHRDTMETLQFVLDVQLKHAQAIRTILKHEAHAANDLKAIYERLDEVDGWDGSTEEQKSSIRSLTYQLLPEKVDSKKVTEDLQVAIKHFLNLNSAQNLVLRALILRDDVVATQLKQFCEKYEIETNEEKVFISEISELIASIEE